MYEEKFRQGLKKIIKEKCLKQSAIAQKAEIREDTLCRILKGNRRIYGDEMARICKVLNYTVDEVMNYDLAGSPKKVS